jgi:signal recognition particle subunit SRP68
VSRLHQFPRPNSIDLTNLVEFPPKLQPVPVKPFFFDIAYNYIGLEGSKMPAAETVEPALPAKVEEKKVEPAKRGWFWNR